MLISCIHVHDRPYFALQSSMPPLDSPSGCGNIQCRDSFSCEEVPLSTIESSTDTPNELSSTSSDSSPGSTPSPEHSSSSKTSSDDNSTSSEMDVESFLGPQFLLTYRIVGDNIDKTIKPRHMTSEHQTQSLHYFNAYAVRDRIDLPSFSSNPPTVRLEKKMD